MGPEATQFKKGLIECQYHVFKPVTELLKLKNPRNRNKHSKAQIERLAKIMRDNGIRHPIVISNQSGFMTKGHGRLEAALLNDWSHYPVQFQDYRNEDLEYADMTADNAIASWAELDFGEINKDLENLGPFDIELLGIKSFFLDPSEKGSNDPSQEWIGMPEYDQEDQLPFRKIVINFKNNEDVYKFSELIRQKITENTKYLWYPEVERISVSDKSYTSE